MQEVLHNEEILLATAKDIASRWDGSGKLYVPFWYFDDVRQPFARTYDSWPYIVKDAIGLLMYGRSGKEYTLDDQGLMTQILGSDQQPLYGTVFSWIFGNMNRQLFDTTVIPIEAEYKFTVEENALASPATDFFFNPAAVEAEWINTQMEFNASVFPIYAGVQDFDTAFPAALSRMKAAGLEKVLVEYWRQLAEHIALKNG